MDYIPIVPTNELRIDIYLVSPSIGILGTGSALDTCHRAAPPFRAIPMLQVRTVIYLAGLKCAT
jgi:hypothetical protein